MPKRNAGTVHSSDNTTLLERLGGAPLICNVISSYIAALRDVKGFVTMPSDGDAIPAPRLKLDAVRELLVEVHAEDVARARTHIDGAIVAAGEQWIALDAVADALAAATSDVAARCASPERMAAVLERLAADLRCCGRARLNA